MGQLVTPPSYRYMSATGEPIIFLAGPIQGARDWQSDAVLLIQAARPDAWIANPRRPGEAAGEFSQAKYEEQVEWEHHHLRYASDHGVILFWCENEAVHDCGRAYAQTTRFEMGEAMANVRWTRRSRMVVGLDTRYTGAKYVRFTFSKKAPNVPILDTLDATVAAALALLPFPVTPSL